MTKQWQIQEKAPADFAADFQGMHPVIRQLLYNRGLRTTVQIEHFLHPELALAHYEPSLFRAMDAAVELIVSHIKARHAIVVCGDYDADGVSSSAIMTEVLSALKANVDVWIPSRFGQGYGLNKQIIDELKTQNVSLIITVDNGIRAKAEAEYAQSLGIDVVITDHHEGSPEESELPQCLVIDPILPTETYPFKYLCGAGVALKLAQALINRSTLEAETKKALYEKLVGLAAIGTVADCVSVLGENRLIIAQGLDVLNHRPRVGIRALMEVSGVALGELNEWNISWQITPRLNVAGRLDHANTAYRLLVTTETEEARKIAAELNQKNIERQVMTATIVEAAAADIEKNQQNEQMLVAISPNVFDESAIGWNEGVIGLSAGRLAERFAKPCFVITRSEGNIKGSGRSVEQCNLAIALEAGKDFLERYGGHKMACGFTVNSVDQVKDFVTAVRAQVAEQLQGVDLSPILRIDSQMSLEEVTDDFIEAIETFAPFGQDNPEPKFSSRSVIEEVMIMGKEKTHIKFRINGMWALAFNKASIWGDYKPGDTVDLVYTVCFNIFNGRREPQLKIIDLQKI